MYKSTIFSWFSQQGGQLGPPLYTATARDPMPNNIPGRAPAGWASVNLAPAEPQSPPSSSPAISRAFSTVMPSAAISLANT